MHRRLLVAPVRPNPEAEPQSDDSKDYPTSTSLAESRLIEYFWVVKLGDLPDRGDA